MFTLTEYLPKGSGEDGTRTRNHLLAKQAHHQLCYIPKKTMQAPGNRPEMANHSMRESNPHCSHTGSQFCVSLLHSSGSGGTRTPDVSDVTGLHSLTRLGPLESRVSLTIISVASILLEVPVCPWVPPKAVTGFDCRVTAELRSRVSCLRRSAHTTKKLG